MSSVGKGIRLKRFQINDPNNELKFVFESTLGDVYNSTITDCSLLGVGIKLPKTDQKLNLTSNEILANSKISWNGSEFALGRMVVKSIRENANDYIIGLSIVDSKIPLEGKFSKFLVLDKSEANAFSFELNSDKFSLASFLEENHTNTDLFSRCQQFSVFLKDWKSNPKFGYNFVRKEHSLGVRVKLDKKQKSGRKDYIMMGSNDYLGFSFHPKVIEDAKKALDRFGAGSTGSHVLTGTCEVHEELCDEISRAYKKEKTILFSSGFAANLGAMQALTCENDLIVADVLSHASLQDGMKMSSATSRFFKHNDIAHLEKTLQEKRSEHFGSLIVTEGIFSMDGDIAPLDKIVKLAKNYNSRTLVDEAHGIGVIGEYGLGVAEHMGILDEVDIIMGNTSKTLGSLGGFLTGDKDAIEWIAWFARSRMFSTSMPPSVAQAALTSIKLMKEEKHLITKLQENIKHFVYGMKELGADVDHNHQSAIVPIVIGDEEKLGVINTVLIESGVFVPPIVYPAVSRKSCRFRFTLSALHSTSDIDFVIQCFERGMEKADFKFNR